MRSLVGSFTRLSKTHTSTLRPPVLAARLSRHRVAAHMPQQLLQSPLHFSPKDRGGYYNRGAGRRPCRGLLSGSAGPAQDRSLTTKGQAGTAALGQNRYLLRARRDQRALVGVQLETSSLEPLSCPILPPLCVSHLSPGLQGPCSSVLRDTVNMEDFRRTLCSF